MDQAYIYPYILYELELLKQVSGRVESVSVSGFEDG